VSSPTRGHRWRLPAKWFCGNGFAAIADATPYSGSAGTAIADSVIAAPLAARKPGVNNAAMPIAATSRAWKDGSITGTGSGPIGSAASSGPA